jgi:transposase
VDNAKFYKSKETVENITSSKNTILNILPYNAQLNPIENLFSQLKNNVRNKSPDNFEELKLTIDRIIKKKIKEEHIKNYFNYLFI